MAHDMKPTLHPSSGPPDPIVIDLISAIIANAERCADDVAGLVSTWQRTVPEFDVRPLTTNLLHKLGALIDLARWERGGVTSHLQTAVPPASAVLADAIAPVNDGGGERFDGADLARKLFAIRYSELAWEPMPARADIVVSGIRPDDLWDELAGLLWRFRHLAIGNNNKE